MKCFVMTCRRGCRTPKMMGSAYRTLTLLDGLRYAYRGHGRTWVVDAETAADARLISAAPEMLEALEQFISGYEAEGIDESIRDLFSWAYKLSRSVIRKAKGLD